MIDVDWLDEVVRTTAAQEVSDGQASSVDDVLRMWQRDRNALARVIPLIQVRYHQNHHGTATTVSEQNGSRIADAMEQLRGLQPEPRKRLSRLWNGRGN